MQTISLYRFTRFDVCNNIQRFVRSSSIEAAEYLSLVIVSPDKVQYASLISHVVKLNQINLLGW